MFDFRICFNTELIITFHQIIVIAFRCKMIVFSCNKLQIDCSEFSGLLDDVFKTGGMNT